MFFVDEMPDALTKLFPSTMMIPFFMELFFGASALKIQLDECNITDFVAFIVDAVQGHHTGLPV